MKEKLYEINNTISINKTPFVYVLALGGTIACSIPNQAEAFYEHPSVHINDLLASLPLEKEKVKGEQFLQKISHEMTHEDLISVAKRIQDLVNDEKIDGVIITHGTNCIEETAFSSI